LLPGPEARSYAKDDQKGIRSQMTPPRSAMNLSHCRRNCELR
jgi:hypothetical protein